MPRECDCGAHRRRRERDGHRCRRRCAGKLESREYRSRHDAAPRQARVQSPPASLQAALDRAGSPSELARRLLLRLALKATEDYRQTILARQPFHFLIDDAEKLPRAELISGSGCLSASAGAKASGCPRRASPARAFKATRRATPCSQPASASERLMVPALRASTRNAACMASSAVWTSPNTRRHVCSTIGPCLWTRSAKA